MESESFVPLNVSCIMYSDSNTGSYTMILHCEKLRKQIPVIIGAWEAHSITMLLPQYTQPSRPMTHDMIYDIMSAYGMVVDKVLIHKFLDGIFYSSVYVVSHDDGREVLIDARTSDAVAMALRFGAPIYTYPSVVEQTGINLRSVQEVKGMTEFMHDMETPDVREAVREQIFFLQEMMRRAVHDEDYESAARIRDEIKKIDPNITI